MNDPEFHEIFFFTRYLWWPRIWHPDGICWEFYGIGARVYYRGRRATIQWSERHWSGKRWVRVRYDKSPYPVRAGMSTYEDVWLSEAIPDMTIQPLYEDEYGYQPEESIGGARSPGRVRFDADPTEGRFPAALGVSFGQSW